MTSLLHPLWPELLLIAVACVLFLIGASPAARMRRLAPVLALGALIVTFIGLAFIDGGNNGAPSAESSVFAGPFAQYAKLLSSAVAILFVLLAWPTNDNATGNSALDAGHEVGEFFALLLLSIAGIFLVASANDIILLFLGIELASIPTYIMVSISRPLPVAQEAGVKYFFLGAMAAAVMLFGFSYLYGTTGSTSLSEIRAHFHPGLGEGESTWQLFAVILLLMGFAFKLAAVPLHAYAGDVYQGAATPVTALLAFVPKTAGMIAVIKLLQLAGGETWHTPETIVKLLWVMAVLTMTFGNVLGMIQQNVKRIFAYSSVAHSGYMLVALTAMVAAHGMSDAGAVQRQALAAVLFYLCAYGIMNTGAFGVLMLLPGRTDTHGRHDADGNTLPTAGSAETLDDIAGQGRKHVNLGLAMAVCCFSLTGLPLTIGFLGKVLLIQPAWRIAQDSAHPFYHLMIWLVILTMLNAAVSAAYYLKIVAYMFLRPDPSEASIIGAPAAPRALFCSKPVSIAIGLSVLGTLYYGIVLPATTRLTSRVDAAAGTMTDVKAATAAAGNPQAARGWMDDWHKAKAIAQQQNRPIFICFTSMDAPGTSFSKKIFDEIFNTPQFTKYANEHLVLFQADFHYPDATSPPAETYYLASVPIIVMPNPQGRKIAEATQQTSLTAQNKTLAEMYNIRGYPTIIVLNPQGQKIADAKYMKGGPDEFIGQLDAALKNDEERRAFLAGNAAVLSQAGAR